MQELYVCISEDTLGVIYMKTHCIRNETLLFSNIFISVDTQPEAIVNDT